MKKTTRSGVPLPDTSATARPPPWLSHVDQSGTAVHPFAIAPTFPSPWPSTEDVPGEL
jgi:hypothetical protein